MPLNETPSNLNPKQRKLQENIQNQNSMPIDILLPAYCQINNVNINTQENSFETTVPE